jgi:hypothetical protein
MRYLIDGLAAETSDFELSPWRQLSLRFFLPPFDYFGRGSVISKSIRRLPARTS